MNKQTLYKSMFGIYYVVWSELSSRRAKAIFVYISVLATIPAVQMFKREWDKTKAGSSALDSRWLTDIEV